MHALIFIDTNIFLDFYRIISGGVGLSLLKHIDDHHERIITSNQIEMEYKKNRQIVILESLSRYKSPDWSGLTPPAFLSTAKPADIIQRNKKEIISQNKKLRKRIEIILKNPKRNDPVFKILNRLFKNKNSFNLSRDMEKKLQIRELAEKRFNLGYPPRKDKDTSFGDSINWEWIIYCAKNSNKDIIIVSRDSDYGIVYNKEPILNDWLSQEFKSRVSKNREIILTDRLAYAFKLVSIKISTNIEKEEEQLLSKRDLLIKSIMTTIEKYKTISETLEEIFPEIFESGINK